MRATRCFEDAGGCNARFAEEFIRGLEKFGYDSYLEDDDCYSVNFWSLDRRIYVWFCVTHLMKAFRNALLASCLEGVRFFMDLYDVSFGWAIVKDIYGKVLAMAGESDVPFNLP